MTEPTAAADMVAAAGAIVRLPERHLRAVAPYLEALAVHVQARTNIETRSADYLHNATPLGRLAIYYHVGRSSTDSPFTRANRSIFRIEKRGRVDVLRLVAEGLTLAAEQDRPSTALAVLQSHLAARGWPIESYWPSTE